MSRLSILVLYMRQDICVQNKNGLKGVKPEINTNHDNSPF